MESNLMSVDIMYVDGFGVVWFLQVTWRGGVHSIVAAITQCDGVVSFGRAAEHDGGGALPGYVS